MPFTTKELVRKHILEHHIGSTTVLDEAIQLTANDSAQLKERAILTASETVKAQEQNDPTMENISFAASDAVTLGHPKLILQSVVLASDSSLGRVYIENVDYSIDYCAGSVRRIATGSIPASGNVVIWYLFYRVYQRGIDYDIDYQRGKLSRRSSGAIESGQWVLADYTTEYGSIDDEAVENAITEANDQLLSFVDPAYRESADRSLVIAETYLAVSIICRIKAMESISPSSAKGVNEAESWSAISSMYRREAYEILARFARAAANFNSPSRA